MKKVLYTWVLVIAIFLLGACSREARLDHRSILDTELGVVFTLGDSRESIEAILGEPIQHYEWISGMHVLEYANGLVVLYGYIVDISVDAVAVTFETESEHGAERFEILGYQIGMARSQIANNFNLNEGRGRNSHALNLRTFVYEQFYDNRGRIVERADANFQGKCIG